MQRFPVLPVELVLDVFEHAAALALCDDVAWVAQLALVSKAAYLATVPILYKVIHLTNSNVLAVLAVPRRHDGPARHPRQRTTLPRLATRTQ